MIVKYSSDVEKIMKNYFKTLNEKERRIYAATEVMKLGYGGTKYISELLSINPKTIRVGIKDLQMLEENPSSENNRIRKPGGGRKKN